MKWWWPRLIARQTRKGLLGRMTENETSDQHPGAEAGGSTAEVRERATRLREKVNDLSKTFERIEKSLAEAGEERKDSRA